MARNKGCIGGLAILALLGIGLATAVGSVFVRTAPTPRGTEDVFLRLSGQGVRSALNQLEEKGVIRSADAYAMRMRIQPVDLRVREGTYKFRAGMSYDDVLKALRTPVRRMVRLPEGWWIARTAARLEAEGVCKAEDYIRLANTPAEFKGVVTFPLPERSLEGFLFPDTYDLPPMTPAKDVITMQLKAFERRVIPVAKGQDLERIVNIAAMVELEAALDEERPRVAGVITNRIKKRMTLDIDATVLYALQEWKVLGPGVVRTVKSPYNTYLNRGLPPGPIGSPGLKSIQAAMNPESHPYLFYVARPDRSHIFTTNYADHRAAIRRARAEFRERAP